MSDTIIVAIISGSLALAGTIFTVWKRGRDTVQKNSPNSESVSPTYAGQPPSTEASVASERSFCRSTHAQIADAIEAVAPFQRDGVSKSFAGARVCWAGPLQSVSQMGQTLIVAISLPNHKGLIFCKAKPEDCEGLLLAPEGAPIQVSGHIVSISKHEAQLIHCKIRASLDESIIRPVLATAHS